ncbi:MAG: hypothetical protein JO307_04395 [Bryobacterales bacterium]|nr:hypothetical protein [Bryobacterales bacterium]MBV9397734.1 hypothetical protein [Bryobacterales bacterium]
MIPKLKSALPAFVALFALAQPQATIAPNPSTAIAVAPIAANDPAATSLFQGGRSNLQPVSILIKNVGTQPILGIVVLTTATDTGGRTHTSRDVRDSFMSRSHAPVLGPGESLLAIPTGVWVRPQDVGAYAADPGGIRQLQRASDWIRLTSSQATVSIDAIVLASGEVDGPDTTNFMVELEQQKQAAQSVLAAINGPSPTSALEQMAAQRIHEGDWLGKWQHQWAGDYLAASRGGSGANVLSAIQAGLTIPTLFRGASANTK